LSRRKTLFGFREVDVGRKKERKAQKGGQRKGRGRSTHPSPKAEAERRRRRRVAEWPSGRSRRHRHRPLAGRQGGEASFSLSLSLSLFLSLSLTLSPPQWPTKASTQPKKQKRNNQKELKELFASVSDLTEFSLKIPRLFISSKGYFRAKISLPIFPSSSSLRLCNHWSVQPRPHGPALPINASKSSSICKNSSKNAILELKMPFRHFKTPFSFQ
jgi:hypothetical protein